MVVLSAFGHHLVSGRVDQFDSRRLNRKPNKRSQYLNRNEYSGYDQLRDGANEPASLRRLSAVEYPIDTIRLYQHGGVEHGESQSNSDSSESAYELIGRRQDDGGYAET